MNTNHYVVDVMTPNPVVVSPTAKACRAHDLAVKKGVHYLLVMDGYRLVGIVCGCDLIKAGAGTPVEFCMRDRPVTIDDQATADAAALSMTKRGVGCLPVVDWCGTLRGVVTRHDLRDAGVLPRDGAPRCATCGTTHGLSQDDGAGVVFCQRCLGDGANSPTAIDDVYSTHGGSD